MTINDTAVCVENEEKPELRDLQDLLRKSIGEEMIVLDYETAMLLPPGENFGSTILKVEAVIKKNKNSPEEKLSMVAKMIPTSDFQKDHLNATASFAKEIFVFEKLIPAFKKLEKDIGVKDEDLIDLLPKFYGGRLSLNEVIGTADNDVVMLMENMEVNGYHTMDRRKGLDYDHVKLAITVLARFHALSMIIRERNPEFFEEARKLITVFPWNMGEHEMDDIIDLTLKQIFEDERIRKYEQRIKEVVDPLKDFEAFRKTEDLVEPWVSITHGDFWVNNIMYREDENGKMDTKLIDFQLANVTSPLKDLPYFLCASVDPAVTDKHFDDLLCIYHEKLVEVLGKAKFDLSQFTKEKFEEQLRRDAKSELFHCVMALKFFMHEASELKDVRSQVMMSEGSDIFRERSWKIISRFVEKKWI